MIRSGFWKVLLSVFFPYQGGTKGVTCRGRPGNAEKPSEAWFHWTASDWQWFRITLTLWLFNIAMDNCPFIEDFPIETSIYKGFSLAMLNNQMVIGGSTVNSDDQIEEQSSEWMQMVICQSWQCNTLEGLWPFGDSTLLHHRHRPLCLICWTFKPHSIDLRRRTTWAHLLSVTKRGVSPFETE